MLAMTTKTERAGASQSLLDLAFIKPTDRVLEIFAWSPI